MRKHLTEAPELCQTNLPFPLLSTAVETGDPEIVQLLIDLGCDPNTTNKFSITALTTAVHNSNLEIARLLLEKGADPDFSRNVISAVVSQNSKTSAMLKLLEEYGADLHKTFPLGNSDQQLNALSKAIEWGNEEAIAFLMERGARLPEEVETEIDKNSTENQIIEFFSNNFGPVFQQGLKEIVPTTPQITIRLVPPDNKRTHSVLFTTGMSASPMQVPADGNEKFKFAELFIELPGEFPIAFDELNASELGWSIEWLRRIATYPVRENTWLGGPVAIVSNGEPPEPIITGSNFTSMLLLAEKSFTTESGEAYTALPYDAPLSRRAITGTSGRNRRIIASL
ncbi:MAG: suppressor of fused domain protein [Planctomycetaceae bacterium]